MSMLNELDFIAITDHNSTLQLKIIQEAITLTIFIPFALLYLKEPFKIDYVYAGLCLLGAVYFMFREKISL